jgi:hypothetical protein
MANPIVRTAVLQAAPVIFDTPRTIAKLVYLTSHAAGNGAEIVVFPEAFIGGYPKGLDFGARLGMRSPEGREDFRFWCIGGSLAREVLARLLAVHARAMAHSFLSDHLPRRR